MNEGKHTQVKVIKREYKSDTFYLIVIKDHLCA